MPTNPRKTINSKGEIVNRPYGLGRWHSPRVRGCEHTDCPNAAAVLRTATAHDSDPTAPNKAHNCCDQH